MAQTVSTQDLARFSPLHALSPDNLKELSQKAYSISVSPGRYLFRNSERSAAQLFLVEGTVELHGERGIDQTLEGGTQAARNALDVVAPRARAALARTAVTAIGVDRDLLDLMLTWDQTGSYRVQELAEAGDTDDTDWMGRLLQTECFRRIPPANIQAIFQRMEPVHYRAGEVIVRQGETGDYFYIVREGHCQISRATASRPNGVRLAELGPADSFGEEALISDKPRNATATMLGSGTLMRISKGDFNALLTEPLLDWVDFNTARELAQAGAQWVDVRLPAEYERGHIQGARNIPLFFLRMKAPKLSGDTTYLVYCDTGRRSSAASFILSQRGFDVRVLRDGMAQAPSEVMETNDSA